MFNRFRKDPNYLMKYHLTVAMVLFCFNAVILYFSPPQWPILLWYLPAILLMTSTELKTVMLAVAYAWTVSFVRADYSYQSALAVLLAVLLTCPLSSWIHSPSHGSMRPRWLNRPLGEFIGLVQLTGFPDWTILHVFHHQHPDDAKLDPHPPLQKNYWEFAFGMRAHIGNCFMRHYFKYFGESPLSIKRVGYFLKAAKFNMLMKVCFWYFVFGPQNFTFFFTTSILLKMLHYAWFNYATHKIDKNGDYMIKNLDHSFYRLINLIASGLYYHGNHHTNPHFHNPKNIPVKNPAPAKSA